MAKLGINTGLSPNDGNGDSLLSAAIKINENFNELYDTFGNGTSLNKYPPYSVTSGVSTTTNNINISELDTNDTLVSLVLVKDQVLGKQSPIIDSGLTYNANTSTLNALVFNGNLSGNANSATNSIFSQNCNTANYATSAGISTNATTADYSTISGSALNATSADYAKVSGLSTNSTYSNYASVAGIATNSNYSQVSGFSTISSYATFSGIATNATNATYSTYASVSDFSILSGISSLSNYASVSGIASFAQGIFGVPNITVGDIIANNISVIGTLSYEDVVNVDSIGLVTARTGIDVLTGDIDVLSGDVNIPSGGINVNSRINISSGGINAVGVITGSNFVGSGSNLTNLNADNISSGTVPAQRLASGSPDSTTFLRGDQTWQQILPPNDGTLTLSTSGVGLSGTATFSANTSSSVNFTVSSNATSNNSPSTIVSRDASGNFSANIIIGSLSGVADRSTRLATARNINLIGDVTGSISFDGTQDVSLIASVSDDSHNHIISNVDGLQDALDLKAPLTSPALTGTPTAPTASPGTNTTQVATTAFVSTAVSNLVDTAPSTLNTLNELAAALGDDPNFATTVSTSIGTKLDASSYTASDVLTKIKTVDGSGSGLDADLLDGQQGSYYTNASNINSGTLPIVRGGTNFTGTPTGGGIAYGTGSAFAFTSAGTTGQVLTSNGSNAPTWQNPTGTLIRTTVSGTTSTISPGSSTDLSITGYSAYALLKVQVSAPSWVVLYTDTTARSNDSSRDSLTDPLPGSGVIAEVYTTVSGSSTFLMTPGVIGWNNSSPTSNTIFAKVMNTGASSAAITVTLTLIPMEE